MDAVRPVKRVPAHVRRLSFGERWKWARTQSGKSHDRIVAEMGRSNRGHLIKIEKGDHAPRQPLREAYADATGVPHDLFADEDDEESDPVSALMNAIRRVVREEVHARTADGAAA